MDDGSYRSKPLTLVGHVRLGTILSSAVVYAEQTKVSCKSANGVPLWDIYVTSPFLLIPPIGSPGSQGSEIAKHFGLLRKLSANVVRTLTLGSEEYIPSSTTKHGVDKIMLAD
jgi:hypothetical protein